MIEDQVAPKRCGHTKEKAVVDRGAAVMRVRAAVDAAREAAAEGACSDAPLSVDSTCGTYRPCAAYHSGSSAEEGGDAAEAVRAAAMPGSRTDRGGQAAGAPLDSAPLRMGSLCCG